MLYLECRSLFWGRLVMTLSRVETVIGLRMVPVDDLQVFVIVIAMIFQVELFDVLGLLPGAWGEGLRL